jgi:hypothetical protein
MSARALSATLLVVLVMAAGCVPRSQRVDVRDPAVQSRMAVMALLREDFAFARPTLLELAARCQAGEHGRRAVLLLAAAELDTGNEGGSPQTALQLARAYLLLPNAPREEVLLARSLYRLAANLGGLEETAPATDSLPLGVHVAPRFDGCGSAPELAITDETLAGRERRLEASLAARSDSLATVRSALAASRRRVEELETELARITELLTTGAERHTENVRP